MVAGCGSDRQMGGHLARRRLRSRQRPARLEMEGLTYREGEIRVHGLTDQFVMKGQALAGLAQYPGPKASWRLLTSAELGLSRTVERSASENDGPRIEATRSTSIVSTGRASS